MTHLFAVSPIVYILYVRRAHGEVRGIPLHMQKASPNQYTTTSSHCRSLLPPTRQLTIQRQVIPSQRSPTRTETNPQRNAASSLFTLPVKREGTLIYANICSASLLHSSRARCRGRSSLRRYLCSCCRFITKHDKFGISIFLCANFSQPGPPFSKQPQA